MAEDKTRLQKLGRWVSWSILLVAVLATSPLWILKSIDCLPPMWERMKLYPSAYSGDIDAQIGIANSYIGVKFCSQGEWAQFHWRKKAAEQGHPGSAYRIGEAFEDGTGIGQNFDEARAWYERAAGLGNSQAAYRLKVMASWPDENKVFAAAYRERAASRQADPYAGANVGTIFRDCAECPEMVVVPGSATGQIIAVGRYEVTIAEYGACALSGKCDYGRRGDEFRYRRDPVNPDFPITELTKRNIREYLNWLKSRTGRDYRLLSDVEWRHLAMGGEKREYPWKKEPAQACIHGNLDNAGSSPQFGEGFPCHDGYIFFSPVGTFQPNIHGVFDLFGNASELVMDCGGRHCATDTLVEIGGHFFDGLEFFQKNTTGKTEFRYLHPGPYYLAGTRVALTLKAEVPQE